MIFSALFKEIYSRDKGTVFWIFVFPTVMYLLFSSVFGGMGKNLTVKVGIVGYSRYFEEAVTHLEMDIRTVRYESLDSLKRDVENGKVDIGIDLRNFDRDLFMSVMTGGNYKTELTIFGNNDDISKLALDIFRSLFENADIEMLKLTGRVKGIEVDYVKCHSEISSDEYYAVTGIVLALMGTGIFGVAYSMSEMRRGKIFKVLSVTPLKPHRVFLEFLLVHLTAAMISSGVVVASAYFLKGTMLSFLEYPIMALLGSALYTSLGFFIYSVSKSKETASIIANMLYFIMMFTGNLYFEVEEGIMRLISKLNPTSHLVHMMRLGEFKFPDLLVLTLWITGFVLVTLRSSMRGESVA